jgi:hypothetical protein
MIDALTRGRAAMLPLMVDTYTITRTARVSDGGGGWVDGSSTIVSGICGLVILPKAQFEQGGAQVQQRGHYRLHVPTSDEQIQPGDVLTVNGRQLRVVWTPPVNAMSLVRKIGLEEVDQ